MKLSNYPIRLVIILSSVMLVLLSSNLVLAHSTVPQQSATTQQVINGVQNTTTLETFDTIQAAIDDVDTLDGHTLTVVAGEFNESLLIYKQLTILGANAGVNPNTGTRIAESIIRPPVAIAIFADEFSGATIIYPLANNITIDGFTINGDNLNTVAPNGFVLPDGERIDAAYGVFGGGNNITIQNNIFTNISAAGVWLNTPGYGLVTQNLFVNLDAPASRGGLTTDDFYADVTNNVFDEVATGWQTDRQANANTNPANPRILIADNDFTVNNMGIFINRHSGASPDYTISNNIIRSDTRTSGNLRGIQFFAIQEGIDIDVNNNIIQGTPTIPFNIGVTVWDIPNANPVTITDLLVDYAAIGIDMYDCNRQFGQSSALSILILNNAEIRNTSNIGLRVIDNFFGGTPTARPNDNQACSESGAGGAGLPSSSVSIVAADINFNNNAGLAAIHVTTDPLDPQGANYDPTLIISDTTITGGTTTQQILLDGNGRLELISSFLNGNNNNIIGMTVNSPNNFFRIETSHIYNHRPNNGIVINQTDGDSAVINSCFYNNAFGVQNNSGITVNATANWWGNVTGPSTTGVDPFRDAVSANVDFAGFLTTQPTVAGVLCLLYNQPPTTTPATPPSGLTPAQLGVTQLPATGETPLWAVYLRQILQWMGFPLP
ncbi:MAG TPA: hypothetical protein PLZ51_08470 [Aggregatilineales bacterium]|nr:hypothetical protein [Aggregatilineales bacterium]